LWIGLSFHYHDVLVDLIRVGAANRGSARRWEVKFRKIAVENLARLAMMSRLPKISRSAKIYHSKTVILFAV
jgi:hypothetical protein